jgi:hypothetical protein
MQEGKVADSLCGGCWDNNRGSLAESAVVPPCPKRRHRHEFALETTLVSSGERFWMDTLRPVPIRHVL